MRFLILLLAGLLAANEKPPFHDYCAQLEQEIQGRKHGFLAGNLTYYIGGYHASWQLHEDETIGLTHPFHHDLRSRGVGLVESDLRGPEHTGIGNDYHGWEFYKDTRVLYGSVIINGKTHKHPAPKRMRWRPDRLVCEYQIDDIQIREEKFVTANDAIVSIITSNKPVLLEFSGHTLFTRHSITSTAQLKSENQTIIIKEGGTVRSQPDPNGAEKIGPCVYQGMTTVLHASRDFDQCNTRRDDKGIQHYNFT
ncbi:hypothetical protein OAG53_01675, partial [Akkermansiaceae bacterium]|nr:hypothetical protein [Akkermansiaceae bacterium]